MKQFDKKLQLAFIVALCVGGCSKNFSGLATLASHQTAADQNIQS
jgi:hypothetical protein